MWPATENNGLVLEANIFIDRGDKFLLYKIKFYPPAQETAGITDG
jgi:hypothetical protein